MSYIRLKINLRDEAWLEDAVRALNAAPHMTLHNKYGLPTKWTPAAVVREILAVRRTSGLPAVDIPPVQDTTEVGNG